MGMKPPPQLYLLAGALGWNVRRGMTGQGTISMFSAQAPVVFIVGWGFLTSWIIPHIWRRRAK